LPGAVVRPCRWPGLRGGPWRSVGAAATELWGCRVLRPRRAWRGRAIAVARVARASAALPVFARPLGRGAAARATRGSAAVVGQRDRVYRNRAGRAARGPSAGRPGAPDPAADRAGATG